MNRVTFLPILVFIAGCSNSEQGVTSSDAVYESCLEVFRRKGDVFGIGDAMCDSMKKACEKDLDGKECKKAQRMIKDA